MIFGTYFLTEKTYVMIQQRSITMFIRLKKVIEITALSRPTVYRLMQQGKFPKQIKLGEKSVAWLLEEVEQWMKERLAERS